MTGKQPMPGNAVQPAAVAQPEACSVEALPGWRVVAGQECRDLWLTRRGPLLLFLFSVLLSGVTYLTSTNQATNFLEQREAVNLLIQFAIAVGALAALVVSADAVSGERERGTLEAILVTPVSRRSILTGKLAAALSMWLGTFVVSIPYVWLLGRGVEIVAPALLLGILVGTVVAFGLGSVGLLISALSNSNKVSLAASLFLLVLLFAPTQLPGGLPQGWFFDVLVRLNPVASALSYISGQLVQGQAWTEEFSYLVSPLAIAAAAGSALYLGAPRLLMLTAWDKAE